MTQIIRFSVINLLRKVTCAWININNLKKMINNVYVALF